MSKHQENVIREKRTIEATKKNLMGPAGKFGVILQAFGTPVLRQGYSSNQHNFIEDPYEDNIYQEFETTISGQNGPLAYRDEISYMESESIHNEGLYFDGLSRGLHLEITYWQADSQLKVMFKGYPVYIEIAGELQCYVPSDSWETFIDKLYSISKNKIKKNKKDQEKELENKILEKKINFWQNIKARWGV